VGESSVGHLAVILIWHYERKRIVSEQEKPPVDNPIASSAEDVLDGATVAHDFAKGIRRLVRK
jgi:hypothetical protein